jgi:DNA repair exonuclease SbcCD ATPase subunit
MADEGRSRALPVPSALRTRLDRAVRARVDDALSPLRRRVRGHERRLKRLERLHEQRQVDKVPGLVNHFERLQVQVASLETRLEEVRQLLEDPLQPGTSEERAEARGLLDEIRREHQQIRARMTAVSWYEDRLRKLEDAVGDTAR